MQADWRVTVEVKSSVNKLAGFFPSPITTIHDIGATSPIDVTGPVPASTQVDKTLKESVPAEQGQLLRAAGADHGVLKVRTQRLRNTVELTRSPLGDCGEAVDDLLRRRQDPE